MEAQRTGHSQLPGAPPTVCPAPKIWREVGQSAPTLQPHGGSPALLRTHTQSSGQAQGTYLESPPVWDRGLTAAHAVPVVEVCEGPCGTPGLKVAGHAHRSPHLQGCIPFGLGEVLAGRRQLLALQAETLVCATIPLPPLWLHVKCNPVTGGPRPKLQRTPAQSLPLPRLKRG